MACEFPRIAGTGGAINWGLKRLRNGHRTYTITHRVELAADSGGPGLALATPGLPEPGSLWEEFGLLDEWAYFTQEAEVVVSPGTKQGEVRFFDVTQIATTEPSEECAEENREDPLTRPDIITVETINYQKEATIDRNGDPIVNSAFEQFRGPAAEFDAHRLRVVVEQNVANLELDLIQSLMHHLNDGEMWGFAARMIKLSEVKLAPKFHTNCEKYVARRLVFDVADDFDRCILDEGTKVLRGRWDKNPESSTYGQYIIARGELNAPLDYTDPANYIRYQDWHGNNARVILNGKGRPWDAAQQNTATGDDTAGQICVEYYPEANLLLLGLPLNLENP